MACRFCKLQFLASLSLLYDAGWWKKTKYSPPQTKLQLPEALPRLRHLQFGSCHDWGVIFLALWPLAVLAAHSTRDYGRKRGACTVCAICKCHVEAATACQCALLHTCPN
jgi:hypothetical protein